MQKMCIRDSPKTEEMETYFYKEAIKQEDRVTGYKEEKARLEAEAAQLSAQREQAFAAYEKKGKEIQDIQDAISDMVEQRTVLNGELGVLRSQYDEIAYNLTLATDRKSVV